MNRAAGGGWHDATQYKGILARGVSSIQPFGNRSEKYFYSSSHGRVPVHKASSVRPWSDGFGLKGIDWPAQTLYVSSIQALWGGIRKPISNWAFSFSTSALYKYFGLNWTVILKGNTKSIC